MNVTPESTTVSNVCGHLVLRNSIQHVIQSCHIIYNIHVGLHTHTYVVKMSLKKTDNIHVDQIQQQLTLPSASYSQITKNLLAELV